MAIEWDKTTKCDLWSISSLRHLASALATTMGKYFPLDWIWLDWIVIIYISLHWITIIWIGFSCYGLLSLKWYWLVWWSAIEIISWDWIIVIWVGLDCFNGRVVIRLTLSDRVFFINLVGLDQIRLEPAKNLHESQDSWDDSFGFSEVLNRKGNQRYLTLWRILEMKESWRLIQWRPQIEPVAVVEIE